MKGNEIFNEIFKEQANSFIHAFQIASKNIFYNPEKKNKLHHAGEFGIYREKIVAKFLTLFTPQRLEIDSGFIISPNNETSKQHDIIVYGKNETPLIKSEEGQKFFPMESIASVGEIKSNLDKETLKKELENLVNLKRIRENLKGGHRVYSFTKSEKKYNPKEYPQDQISTFIICNKFNFSFNHQNVDHEINQLYTENTPERFKVDLFLSIEDGFIGYYNKTIKQYWIHPNFETNEKVEKVKLEMVYKNLDKFSHLKEFSNQYYNRLIFNSVLKPELGFYLAE